jgi:hypothetical protein
MTAPAASLLPARSPPRVGAKPKWSSAPATKSSLNTSKRWQSLTKQARANVCGCIRRAAADSARFRKFTAFAACGLCSCCQHVDTASCSQPCGRFFSPRWSAPHFSAPRAARAASTAALPLLQTWIDLTPTGGRLQAPAGTYAGPAVISRAMVIDGEGKIIVDGGGTGTVLSVRATGVTIRGLHLKHAGDWHHRARQSRFAPADRKRQRQPGRKQRHRAQGKRHDAGSRQ